MKRILILDDDDQMRTLIFTVLKRAGYDVVAASNGVEGMALFSAGPSDLVITDLLMPEKDGLETIRELHAEFPNVRIIAISGGSQLTDMDFLQIARKFGAHKVLAKPFSKEELLQTVQEELGQLVS